VPGVDTILPVQRIKKRLWHRSKRFEARILGVMPEYFRFFNMECARGRFITDLDIDDARRVCVVGSRILEELGYFDDPLDLDVRIGTDWFRVCGVYAQPPFLSPTAKALGRGDIQMDVFVPYATAKRRYGVLNIVREEGTQEYTRVELDQIIVRVSDESKVLGAAELVAAVLKKAHEKMDYEIIVPLELLRQRQKTQRVFSAVMVAIASISLLVGGIGIVNIMLATVTERTSEIGVRRACGARKREILVQFLIETLTLTVLGGILGCALGVSGASLMSRFSEWRTIITPGSLFLAMGISCLVGVIFGMYPAHKAAEMDPIEALRYE
jgi:putative ABC transport system permease protein